MEFLEWLRETELGAMVSTILVSMVPVLELRGGIPWGVAHGLSHFAAFVCAVIGNMIPLPFIVKGRKSQSRRGISISPSLTIHPLKRPSTGGSCGSPLLDVPP